jgi:hypothetical protein
LVKRVLREREMGEAEQRRRADAATQQVEVLSRQKDETLSQHVAAAAEARRRAEHATVQLAAVGSRLQQRDQQLAVAKLEAAAAAGGEGKVAAMHECMRGVRGLVDASCLRERGSEHTSVACWSWHGAWQLHTRVASTREHGTNREQHSTRSSTTSEVCWRGCVGGGAGGAG